SVCAGPRNPRSGPPPSVASQLGYRRSEASLDDQLAVALLAQFATGAFHCHERRLEQVGADAARTEARRRRDQRLGSSGSEDLDVGSRGRVGEDGLVCQGGGRVLPDEVPVACYHVGPLVVLVEPPRFGRLVLTRAD